MVCLICTPQYDWAQFRNLMRLRYKRLLQWQQNRSKATMWQLYELQLFGVPRIFLLDWPSCGCKHWYLWVSPVLRITFIWIIWVQYATDNLSGQERVFLHRPVLLFQPTVNSNVNDDCSKPCQNQISQLGKMHSYEVLKCLHIQSGPKKCIHSLLINIFGISYDSVWMSMVATSNTYIESKIQGHLSYQFCFCINTVVMIIE